MTSSNPRGVRAARLVTACVALVTMAGALLADLIVRASAVQHLRNDNWPAHAKFHDAQYIVMSILLGALALALLAARTGGPRTRIRLACAVLATPWLGLFAALLFPETAVQDPEFDNHMVLGLHPQVLLAAALLALLTLAGLLTRRTRG
ncbi:DUF6640 family protein [Nocardia sp. NPDC127579]|uniref:DUF6640 family protein n=1 Tax=Nocardia sp. NPDC127579 TaxID=3345402 RepID=UPI00363024A3